MQRDLELARDILLVVEREARGLGWVQIEVPGKSTEEIAEHVKLLYEAGYLDAQDVSTLGGLAWRPKRLTWQGHEFLTAIRNDTVWNKLKRAIADKGGSIPFELLKELATTIARAHFIGSSV